ncbi:MAG TPA: M20 family metallopeptidase [Pyrinomonadaceae bacterium]|jgi:glutamate carboxypeptidase|nr:M20 family metallopeptidase [Pyrinomonadaceae bacterium]
MPFELNSSNADKLLRHFEGRRGEVLSLTRSLCEVESPSGDGEGSRAVVNLLAEAASSIGGVESFERIVAADGYGEHLLVRAFAKGARDERALLLLGHTDTVHPRGTLAARPWREDDDGKIFAPGVFDMKASCAVALESLRACASLGLKARRPVTLLLTCDEESGSMSGRALVESEARRAECVLVLEPPAPGRRAKTGRKGTGLFTLTVEGRAAHAGLEPEKGVSAVLELARQIERVCALARAELGTTINVGTVSGGTHANVVAAEARAEVDVRFSTSDEARRVEAGLRELRPFDERAALKVTGGINRPPLERTAAVLGLYERARRVAALLDFELGEASVGGASDGNFAAACGATVLDGLGIDGDGAHAAHEHIQADAVVLRGALLAALVATL